jgi:serpin B
MRKALLSALPLLAVACADTSEPFQMAKSSLSRDPSPVVSTNDAAQLASDNAAFGAALYAQLRAGTADDQNLFFSPYSISSAIAMTYAGARGTTETEMAAAMHFTLPQDRLHTAFNSVDLQLASRGQGAKGADGKAFRLNVVNSTFGEVGYPFEKPFLDTLAKNYGAGIRLCDFAKQPDAERKKINGWVSDQTESRIQDLLGPDSIHADTRMVLVNAVYFNASWAEHFQKSQTQSADFTKLDGSIAKVDMMNQVHGMQYAADDAAQVVEVPYDGGQLAMDIVLPRGDFKAYESSFDAAKQKSTFDHLQSKQVALSLPKFTIKGATFSLKPALQGMGMNVPFIDGQADFSGIVAPAVDQLHIADALHQAFVRVDEDGTEAAAATAVVVDRGLAVVDPPVPFTANKPFLFFVRDLPTGTILFSGRVVNP